MNSSDDIRIERPSFLTPLRVLLTFTVVISAYDTGQAVLSLIELAGQPGMDGMLVFIWLLSAPLSFICAVCLFLSVKKLREGKSASMTLTVGIGAMVLSSVAALISQANILNGRALSIMVLCGIVLVCYVIIFLYYQKIGTKPLTIFAAVMGVLCGGYYLMNGILLIKDQPEQILGYLFVSYLTAFLVAVCILVYTFAVGVGPVIEEVDSDDRDPVD
ncbi:MAG: hypothetical protein IJ807_01990 [Eubacterium sp.]|nr:hypothetical protein [Eubacterium sp.]